MDSLPQALLFLGIIPALILIYISLKGYEGYYKDKIVFITFVIGIITGFISIIIEAYTAAVGILFIILYALLEQLFKTMFLNLRRFHGKKETTIYGLSLGLGFGSVFIPSSLILLNIQGYADSFTLALTILGSLGFVLIHGASGVYIGFGVYSYSLIKYFLISFLVYIPVTLWIYITTLLNKGYLQLAIFPYGILLYWHATTKIMPKILNDKKSIENNKKN